MSNPFNYRCPNCRSQDHIEILAFVSIRLTSTGVQFLEDEADFGPANWSSAIGAGCDACGFEGVAGDFEPPATGAKVISINSRMRKRQ
jgi:hypothetical protein